MHARRLAARDDVDFTPREPVRWLAPGELARTALKAALSSAFAGYWDKRETQAGLGAELVEVPADPDGGLWLDYTADTGDGFDATATVAWLLAQDTLDPEGAPVLPRGRVLVLGGDEVYPTPTVGDYDDRLKGPLRAMLPQTQGDDATAPLLLAVPGNHDWYDGLTAFLRTFAQRRRIGGWRTVQSRSYWAARLPQGWWLVGLDTQLGTELDDPQVRFFRDVLGPQLAEGDALVVCAPTPTWVRVGEGRARAFDQLQWFEQKVARPHGAQVRLWLSGDDHHYAHYVEAGVPADATAADATAGAQGSPRHAVTCGLGGAYLASTHDLPEEVVVPGPGSRMPQSPTRYRLTSRWPDATASRRLAAGVVTSPTRMAPVRNPGFWSLIGSVHVLAFLVLSLALALGQRRSPAAAVAAVTPGQVGHLGLQVSTWCAWIVGAAVVTTFLRRARFGWVAPALSGLAQLALVLLGLAGAAAVPWPTAVPAWVLYLAALAFVGAVSGFVGAWLIGLTMLVIGATGGTTGLARGARETVMSSQAIETHKGLLRLRLRPDGVLVVHPLGVLQPCRDWDAVPATSEHGPADQTARFARRRPRTGAPADRGAVRGPAAVTVRLSRRSARGCRRGRGRRGRRR
ncbi:MAG: hypothetical protein U0Q15_03875 [Kineosporiaceae bacterium]